MKKIFPIEIFSIKNPIKRVAKVFFVIVWLIGSPIAFTYMLLAPLQINSYSNTIYQKEEEIKKLNNKLQDLPEASREVIDSQNNIINSLRKEIEEIKKAENEKKHTYDISATRIGEPEKEYQGHSWPTGYSDTGNSFGDCYKDLFNARYEIIKDDQGKDKVRYFLDGKFNDLSPDKYSFKDRNLPYNTISRELNLNCDERDGKKEYLSTRTILKNGMQIAKFFYSGTNLDEYSISKDSQFLWGIGEGEFSADWSVLDLKNGKFKYLGYNSCPSERFDFTSDGQYVVLSDVSTSSILEKKYIYSSSCTFKVNGDFVDGVNVKTEVKQK